VIEDGSSSHLQNEAAVHNTYEDHDHMVVTAVTDVGAGLVAQTQTRGGSTMEDGLGNPVESVEDHSIPYENMEAANNLVQTDTVQTEKQHSEMEGVLSYPVESVVGCGSPVVSESTVNRVYEKHDCPVLSAVTCVEDAFLIHAEEQASVIENGSSSHLQNEAAVHNTYEDRDHMVVTAVTDVGARLVAQTQTRGDYTMEDGSPVSSNKHHIKCHTLDRLVAEVTGCAENGSLVESEQNSDNCSRLFAAHHAHQIGNGIKSLPVNSKEGSEREEKRSTNAESCSTSVSRR
jgi:hypothetical protein